MFKRGQDNDFSVYKRLIQGKGNNNFFHGYGEYKKE